MGLLDPTLPQFDLEDWAARPYHERLRMMCRSWALEGFGAPVGVYAFYAVKIGLYVGGWLLLMVTTPGIGGVGDIASWWAEPVAFQKAVLWTMAFEGLGLGAATGPLTARYVPPVGGFLYFLRPGTTRLPPWPRIPLTGGHRRTLFDVGLYLGHYALLLRVLTAGAVTAELVLPVVITLPLLGLRDKTIFLAARAEHYWVTAIVFLFPGDLLAGSKVVQLSIWFWAATSKLNHHFPSVVAVMISNSPLLGSERLRRAAYRDFPDDLRPSWLPTWLAHGGTAIEYVFPLVLVLSDGGWPTTVALVVMTSFHLFILLSVPLGVPNEWNVFFIYSMFVLFGVHADVSILSIDAPLLVAVLVAWCALVPALGNLFPDRVSFLPSMRYYAGNWATSLWLFRRDAIHKLDEGITKIAPEVADQLRMFYDDTTTEALLGKALAFRSMHLHGRALNDLVPLAVEDVEDYVVRDGEVVAGIVIGWNFGDGHLHHEQLLGAIQEQCGFAEGEVRAIFLESQPFHRPSLHWRIADAARGQLDEGHVTARDLGTAQPWPDGAAIEEPRSSDA